MSLKTRIWVLGTVLICGVLVLLGVLGGLLPQLTAARSTQILIGAAEMRNDAQRTQLAALVAAEPRRAVLTEQLAELREAMPATVASAAFARELHDIEGATGARVVRFSLLPPVAATTEVAAEAPSDGTASDTEAEAPEASAAAGGTITIPVSLEVSGGRDQVVEFARRLQLGSRLLTVDSVEQRGGGSSAESDTLTLTGAIYVAPAA